MRWSGSISSTPDSQRAPGGLDARGNRESRTPCGRLAYFRRARGGAEVVVVRRSGLKTLLTVTLVVVVASAVWVSPVFPQAKRCGTITFGLYQEPETLNPYIFTQTASDEVLTFVADGLVGVDEKGEYFPQLATQLPSRQNGGVSADGKTVTYTLREGLKW